MSSGDSVLVHVDIETGGPTVGIHNMFSLGALATTEQGQVLGAFEGVLKESFFLVNDHRTMAWWATKPEAYQEARNNPAHPEVVVVRFVSWVKEMLEKQKVARNLERAPRAFFVAFPVIFDGSFVRYYINRFFPESLNKDAVDVFAQSYIDGSTYAMGVLGGDRSANALHKLKPAFLSKEETETWESRGHQALYDAVVQALVYFRIKINAVDDIDIDAQILIQQIKEEHIVRVGGRQK